DPSRLEMNPYQYASSSPINRVDPTGNLDCLAPTNATEVLLCTSWDAFKAHTEVIWQQRSETAVEVLDPVVADTALPTVILWLTVAHQLEQAIHGASIRTVAGCDLAATTLTHGVTEPALQMSAVVSGEEYVSYFSGPEYDVELERFRSIVAGVDTKSEENSDGTVLYHYSPIELFPNIQAEGLRPSGLGPGGRDAIHGIGQYFTDISPQEAASVKRGEFMYALYQDARRHGFTKPIG